MPGVSQRLRRADLPVDTATLARFLIGKTLVHDHPDGRMSGRIVETEAYVVGDAAGHAYRGRTARNGSLFLERGHAYVYFIYGCWYALNVSGERAGVGGGVLLRALEPLEGIAQMRRRRGRRARASTSRGAPAGWPRRWTSTGATTATICVRPARCGSVPRFVPSARSAAAPGSASAAKSSVSFASSNATMRLSVARGACARNARTR